MRSCIFASFYLNVMLFLFVLFFHLPFVEFEQTCVKLLVRRFEILAFIKGDFLKKDIDHRGFKANGHSLPATVLALEVADHILFTCSYIPVMTCALLKHCHRKSCEANRTFHPFAAPVMVQLCFVSRLCI